MQQCKEAAGNPGAQLLPFSGINGDNNFWLDALLPTLSYNHNFN